MIPTRHVTITERDLKASIPCQKLWPAIEKMEELLRAISEVTAQEAQIQKDCSRVAVYVVLCERPEEKILNLTTTGPRSFQVEFRYSGYLPEDVWDRLARQTLKIRYVSQSAWSQDELISMTRAYVQAIRSDVLAGIVAQGSDPERRVHRMLLGLLPKEVSV